MRDNYGDLPLNQSQFPRTQPLMGLQTDEKDVTVLSPLSGIIRASEDEIIVANGHANSKTIDGSNAVKINGDARRAPSPSSSGSMSLVSSPEASTDNLDKVCSAGPLPDILPC